MNLIRTIETAEGAWLNADDIKRAFQDDANAERALAMLKVGHMEKDPPMKVIKVAAASFLFPTLKAEEDQQRARWNN